MKIGFIGLGKMGRRMVLRLLEQEVEVVVWNRSPEPIENLKFEISNLNSNLKLKIKNSLAISQSIDDLVEKLETPRIIWLMVTAGQAVDSVIEELSEKLTPGDLVIDGGNSFYKDTLRRAKLLGSRNIHFMDVGTSGGVESARSGACLMVGGSKEDFKRAEEVLKALAAPQAYGLLGPVGAGHFVKMIHNGIEYGMMEAIGEGAAILKNSEFDYDLREVFRVYSKRSIIESRLVSWTLKELQNDPDLTSISSTIGSGGTGKKVKGEAHWTLEIAKKMGVKVPVIEASVKVRDASSKDPQDSPSGFRNKVVAAMRWQFGQHPVKKEG